LEQFVRMSKVQAANASNVSNQPIDVNFDIPMQILLSVAISQLPLYGTLYLYVMGQGRIQDFLEDAPNFRSLAYGTGEK
jgi:hypothetical protein